MRNTGVYINTENRITNKDRQTQTDTDRHCLCLSDTDRQRYTKINKDRLRQTKADKDKSIQKYRSTEILASGKICKGGHLALFRFQKYISQINLLIFP